MYARRMYAHANRRERQLLASASIIFVNGKEKRRIYEKRKRETDEWKKRSKSMRVSEWVNDTRVRSQSTLITADAIALVAGEWFMTDEKGFESANAANYRSAHRIISLSDDLPQLGVIRQRHAFLIGLARMSEDGMIRVFEALLSRWHVHENTFNDLYMRYSVWVNKRQFIRENNWTKNLRITWLQHWKFASIHARAFIVILFRMNFNKRLDEPIYDHWAP